MGRWESEWIQSRANYEVYVRQPVIVMEPVKGDSLARVPAEAENLFRAAAPDRSIPSWAIRFAASLPNVMVVLSGMSSMEQMEDNLSYMDEFIKVLKMGGALPASPVFSAVVLSLYCPGSRFLPNVDFTERFSASRWMCSGALCA